MNDDAPTLRLAVPKGRMYEAVTALLAEAGMHLKQTARSYRPHATMAGCEVKVLKPQNIVEMLQAGSRDLGFTGADWVAELDGELVEVTDTGLDPVRVVAAAPEGIVSAGELPRRRLVVASEYQRLTRRWVERRGLDARLVRSYGATEVFPPEDADVIVDNTATGATLQANDLVIVDELLCSSTRLYASPQAFIDPCRRAAIERFDLLVRSVLEARKRVMVEVNVTAANLPGVLEILPAMRQPTVSPLADGGGFAVKAAVPRERLPEVIPMLRARGARDLVVTRLDQIVP